MRKNHWIIFAASVSVLAACAGRDTRPVAAARMEPPDCKAWAGYDRDVELPGYMVNATCIPLMVTASRTPADYGGGDYHITEFTDAKLKSRWAACKADPACNERLQPQLKRWLPPNTARSPRSTGAVDAFGKIDPESPNVDLKSIRRPAYFAKTPYNESIAEAEPRAYTVEFTVPRDTYEQLKLNMRDTIRLRGWYLDGAGVDDGSGRKVRALIVMSNGGGGQLTAIDNPSDRPYRLDPATRKTSGNRFPNATTEQIGQRSWRRYLHEMNRAGFDVLSYDRRGEGISGGTSDVNTLEQGEDIFRALEQLETGQGLRMLTPLGEVLEGSAAAGKLLAGQGAKRIPVVLAGYSRGSMASGWAMHANFVGYCSFDRPEVACRPPRNWPNIKGVILIAPFSSGAGYLPEGADLRDRNIFLGAMAADHHMVFYPNSSQIQGMDKWPAAFFGKGLWDRAESVEGTIAAYNRIRGPKEIVVVRGPHSLESWTPENQRYLSERMVAFASAVATDRPVEGQKRWSNIRELVATSPDSWEPSSAPR
jgi:hypothetical protein